MSKFNLYGSFDSERPIETLGEVRFTDSHEELIPEVKEKTSVETLNPYDIHERAQYSSRVLNDKSIFMDCVIDGGRRKDPLIFTKNTCKETNTCCWEFFLTCVNFTVTNDLVSKLAQVKDTDCVLIHGPATCYSDDAEVIFSAISQCKAKEKMISSPYILDLGAAYILASATKIIWSVCNLIRVASPSVSGGGAMQDARMAFENDMYRKNKMLTHLITEGFLTKEDAHHIVEEQGGVCLHGGKLKSIIDVFNQKHA